VLLRDGEDQAGYTPAHAFREAARGSGQSG
jgi:hypothetical protein